MVSAIADPSFWEVVGSASEADALRYLKELVRLAREEARYPSSEGSLRVKGWEIRRSMNDHGDSIIAMYAAWISTGC